MHIAVNMLVPMISRLLYENDENLQVLSVCALVNYTHNNTPMKNMVMACGAVRKVSTFLTSHNEDLVRHTCALIRNCTKTVQYRQTVASYGIIDKLFMLLKESDTPPYFRPLPTLVQAIAIIGQLAHDPDIKQKITRAFSGKTSQSSNMAAEGQPELISVFRKFLQQNQTLGGIKFTSEARHEALYFHVSNVTELDTPPALPLIVFVVRPRSFSLCLSFYSSLLPYDSLIDICALRRLIP